MPAFIQDLINMIGPGVFNFIVALTILIVGYIVARIIASIVRRLLSRTNLDDRLAEALSEPEDRRKIDVEDAAAKIVFWLLMLFVLVAFFERLGLTRIAEPFAVFLRGLTSVYLPRLGGAALSNSARPWPNGMISSSGEWIMSLGAGIDPILSIVA